MWDLLDTGIEPVSPVLTGRFFRTGPPGKPQDCFYLGLSIPAMKQSYDKPRQCFKKQRYHFADKDPYNQSYGFPVVMYGCENWTIQKAECQKN